MPGLAMARAVHGLGDVLFERDSARGNLMSNGGVKRHQAPLLVGT